MVTTEIPTPRSRDAAAAEGDGCRIDGPCGFCATLTPAARAALAETLADDAATARSAVQQGRPDYLLRWDDAISEQTSQLESATLALSDAPAGARRQACRDFLAVEIAKTVGLIVAAPAGVLVIQAGDALTAGRTALAAVLPHS